MQEQLSRATHDPVRAKQDARDEDAVAEMGEPYKLDSSIPAADGLNR
jgi:hypothetical protein